MYKLWGVYRTKRFRRLWDFLILEREKMSEKNTSVISINFSGVLLVAFIVMKLCGVINWSWWWVLAPIWVPIAIILVILVVIIIVYMMNEGIKSSRSSRKEYRKVKKLRKKFRIGKLDINDFLNRVDTVLSKEKDINRFDLLDVTEPDSISKSIRRHKEKSKRKVRFSLKRWWKEGCVGLTLSQKIKSWWKKGNKKAVEKKAGKKKKKLDIKK